MTLGERIRELRKTLNLTQEVFASRIGTVQNTITGYENMRRNPSSQVITLICREFNVNESWLRTGEGTMFIPKSSNEFDMLKEKYNLSDQEYIFLKKYFELDINERKIIMDFINSVNEDTIHMQADIDIDAELVAYRKQLELQKEATEGLSPLPGGSNTGADKKNGTDGKF